MMIDGNQIKALLTKDVKVRSRQPWMTLLQIIWPIGIFLALYTFRNRFQPKVEPDCQFPTRLLPSDNHLLSFFHSYICTIENQCLPIDKYEDYTTFNEAPLKPILNIVQTFLNEDSLYNAIYELPEKSNFVGAITTIATHKKFKYMEGNIQEIIRRVPEIEKMIGPNFDIKRLFSDSMMFSKSGNIICGRPFPRNDYIRFVNDILETEDFSNINDDELDSMPTKYCKKLYLDITSTNNGKITWSVLKPIIQGKIIYGPTNNETMEIMKLANTTYDDMRRLRDLAESLNTIMIKLRNDMKFKDGFVKLLELAKSPLIQMMLGGSVDIDTIEAVMRRLMTDQTIADIIQTVYNILECFSVDRFVPVENELELEDIALDLDKKNLFYAAVYFNETNDKNIVYKIRVEPDNTPITLETKNRFWFPGPDASMELDLKYHRGFVQIKHSVDTGIIKYKKQLKNEIEAAMRKNDTADVEEKKEDSLSWWLDWDDEDENQTISTTITNEKESDLLGKTTEDTITTTKIADISTSNLPALETTTDEILLTNNTESNKTLSRQKRQGFFGLLFGGSQAKKGDKGIILVNDVQVYTKQFPYPSYIKDDFKNGLYLAQSVQIAFFVALVIQVATCIRYRIWMKESKNTMLMRSMGLKASSEVIAWIITTFIEIVIVFLIACIILYSGGILHFTSFIFLFSFLILFGLCLISFCFLCTTIFSSASTGSVSSVILFLMTFLPYIIIICLDTKLSGFIMFIINLSFSTPFCYAWDNILRSELQGTGLTFSGAFKDGFQSEFTYSICLMVLDLILYIVLAFIIEKFKNDEFKFHKVPREDLNTNIDASLQNVSKVYDSNMKIAASNISLEFPKNYITCLLGRNGAGKSTIIKMLTGQIEPTSGKIFLSQTLTTTTEEQSDQIGLCSQDNILIPNLTTREHLHLYARIKLQHGIHSEVSRTLKSLNFGQYEDCEARNLSGGYQRRLCVAIAFIGSPKIVILDEPCSGVDTKARKCVWELIEILKKGRAVLLATHYLDEAEYLSDSVIIMNEGKIIAKHTPETMKNLFTKTFEINIVVESHQHDALQQINANLNKYLETYHFLENSRYQLRLSIPYEGCNEHHNPGALIEWLETLQHDRKIKDLSISSKTLEEIFNNLNEKHHHEESQQNNSIQYIMKNEKSELNDVREYWVSPKKLSRFEIIKHLLRKRILHFQRNYRLLACILILPVIFEILAMGFMQLRPGGEYDRMLNLSKYELYPDSTEFLTLGNGTEFINNTYELLKQDCDNCMHFKNSKDAYTWILDTNDLYPTGRYGGLTFNDSYAVVWYYNKGYHSMMAWLNDLNTHMLQVEMNDTDYRITTLNDPIKLGDRELTYSSILQQVSDAGVSLLILIAFSLVVAGASVYIVNERVNGEKLQQKLCGVDAQTYWSVALFWDFIIYLVAVLLCVIVLECFAISVYVAKSNLNGICLLLILFGFATIPAVHLFEKIFAEASFANMSIFCLNVVISLTTLTIVIMIDILGETDEAVKWRNFLNRAFLIFPQHALSDGLIEICKNFIVSQVFSRFGIDSYKSPVSSNLLCPHYVSLTILGIIFITLNYAVESHLIRKLYEKIFNNHNTNYELKIVSIQSSFKQDGMTYMNGNGHHTNGCTLKVENLYKAYKGGNYAVKDVSFHVNTGECFGLLGNNGAGKSTLFKILSGQLSPTSGNIYYTKKGISYCPQTSALDPLLTVEECIKFYGKLRRISDTDNLISKTLNSFHLEPYRDVLVKNLSGGNRRKLNVAVTCFGDSNLVLMDEPTSDMDPVTRSLVYQGIGRLIAQQKSIIMTSHTISEIDNVCHRIAVLKDGKLISTGTPEELSEQFGGYYLITIFHEKKGADESHFEMKIKEGFPLAKDIQLHAHQIKFLIKIKPKLKQDITKNDITSIVSDNNHSLTLSELFTKLKTFCNQQSTQFTIVRCRLDKIFEKILESSEFDEGSYTHRGFQTETTTT